ISQDADNTKLILESLIAALGLIGESGYAQKPSKWIGDCKVSQSSIKWITAYQLHYNCTKSTKIGEFPFKLLCERIPTKIGANENNQCFFCKENLAKSH
ncbi:hypothetical protein pdam_00013228, partial [Pocillopora damicornis]